MYMQVDGVQNKQVFLLCEGVWPSIPEIRCVTGSGNRKMWKKFLKVIVRMLKVPSDKGPS